MLMLVLLLRLLVDWVKGDLVVVVVVDVFSVFSLATVTYRDVHRCCQRTC